MSEIENGKVTSCKLSIERDCFLQLELGIECSKGYWQSFGGWLLRNTASKKIDRDSYGIDYIVEVMKVLEINDLNDAVGSYVRVERKDFSSKITGIGHITKDIWFKPEEFGKRYES